jgi:hypothetical protein
VKEGIQTPTSYRLLQPWDSGPQQDQVVDRNLCSFIIDLRQTMDINLPWRLDAEMRAVFPRVLEVSASSNLANIKSARVRRSAELGGSRESSAFMSLASIC